jgi:hypothetical protein
MYGRNDATSTDDQNGEYTYSNPFLPLASTTFDTNSGLSSLNPSEMSSFDSFGFLTDGSLTTHALQQPSMSPSYGHSSLFNLFGELPPPPVDELNHPLDASQTIPPLESYANPFREPSPLPEIDFQQIFSQANLAAEIAQQQLEQQQQQTAVEDEVADNQPIASQQPAVAQNDAQAFETATIAARLKSRAKRVSSVKQEPGEAEEKTNHHHHRKTKIESAVQHSEPDDEDAESEVEINQQLQSRRERNRLSAQTYREKRKHQFNHLKTRIDALEEQHSQDSDTIRQLREDTTKLSRQIASLQASLLAVRQSPSSMSGYLNYSSHNQQQSQSSLFYHSSNNGHAQTNGHTQTNGHSQTTNSTQSNGYHR